MPVLAAVALLAWALPSGSHSRATTAAAAPAVPTAPGVPKAIVNRFDGPRAFALLRAQVRDYGWRPAGSAALRRLALRLRGLLPGGRFEPLAGSPALRNIVGTIPGRRPAILVGAHYDVESLPKGFVGANDGAAGTAAVVYLAKALARAPRPSNARAVRFVLFDGEEEPAGCADFLNCGLRGSKDYAERHAKDVRSMVLLDYIAAKDDLRFPREGGSDPALWEKLRSAAGAVGVGSLFPAGLRFGEILDDHTPFTSRGVPAIDIIDFDYAPRDTLADNLTQVSERSIDAVGEAVYRLVARLRADG
ncbi:MAG: glutaminyl-peptide cyclotransferase [Solirubrobacteraceae bacterium]|nr:glutaminyl-peptide cyclotransferase [Solirubrobacteraceae bacterium]